MVTFTNFQEFYSTSLTNIRFILVYHKLVINAIKNYLTQ
ncbi:hypothetical protein TwortDSMZ_061 [Staphylococcus phage Twort]|uniref:Uncharacterized protein n=2 Tax=Staphylococcus phage Twort (strain DSM 17442 / HER 48) TaxID=2908167 RepID=A0A6H0X576_BPTWO|nr:ORF340 [Staphylococcus phage Twort]AAX92484.1 ORF340 [Staphylococcus phage Twort]QIW89066.1 hypothetical protein TwortDSMZ_061 [Staphylococcus phage Twort]